jgi:CRISPR/Cas system-associated protein Cas10 (large subunit of type III CRISPR-Cas system)
MKLKLLTLSLLFSATAFVARANTNPGNGDETKKNDIAGGVIHAETKKPLGNVNVVAYVANKKEKTATTDGNGNYFFNDLKPGTYKLVFEKDGFKKVTKDKVFIRGDEGCQLNIEMNEVESFLMMPGLLFTDFEE